MKSDLRPLRILLSLAACALSPAALSHTLSVPHVHFGATLAQNPPPAAGNRLPVRKLTPVIRRESRAVSRVIDPRRIRQFDTRSRILPPQALDRSGYVVGSVDGAMLMGTGSRFYARHLPDAELYDLVVPGSLLTDPESGEVLGLETIYLGRARLHDTASGDGLAQLEVLSARREIEPGARLLAAEPVRSLPEYRPEPGPAGVSGQVLKTADRMAWAGQNDVVILSVGRREGVDAGQLFKTLDEGGQATDPVTGERIELPARPSGKLLVLRSFPHASHALVVSSTRPIPAGTRIIAP